MLKKFAISLVFLLVSAIPAFGQDNLPNELTGELTGDAKYACEAVLCLSSGTRPSECLPSLNKYFSISKDKWEDTIKARINFLKLCPASSETPVMSTLSNDLANGSGRCEAADLNTRGQWITQTNNLPSEECNGKKDVQLAGHYSETWQYISGDDSQPGYCLNTVRYWLVDTSIPGYCTKLWNNELTYYEDKPHLFVGENPWETRWVD